MFGQVINRVGNITDFGHKQGQGFGKQAAHPHPIFLAVPPWLSTISDSVHSIDSLKTR